MCAYLIFNAWNTGRLESIVVLHFALMLRLMVGMGIEEVFDTRVIEQSFSWSSLITACSALMLTTMGSRGLLFKNTPEGEDMVVSLEKREEIVDTLYITTYSFFILSFEALLGLGTVAGAILLTRDILLKGYSNALFFVPAIHAIALANLIIQTDIDIDFGIPIGLFLTVEGLAISWFALQNDRVYDLEFFEWESDEIFLDFLDRLGMAGVLSAIVGIFFMFGEIDQWSFAWVLTTVILIAVGIQGYAPDYEARWRRIFGGYGSILSFVAFSIEVENDTMRALSFVGVGLIALGWGFLTMQRLDDDEGIYEVQPDQPQAAQPVHKLKPVFNPKANSNLEIPEPVVEEEPEDSVEEEPEEIEEVEELMLPLPDTISTPHGFEIRLPAGKLDAILKSIQNTPHDGYKPIVGLNQNGQIVIDWVTV